MNLYDLSKLIDASLDEKFYKIKVNAFKTSTIGLKKNDVFIAINTGHNYLKTIKKCKAVIVENDFKSDLFPVLKVSDTKEALRKIAAYSRLKYKGTVIAITGSNGKTTTKELLAHVLSSTYKVFKSYKNMNNMLGVPINVLSLTKSKYAIFELGMNQKGEIEKLSQIVKPDIAIITNIGTAHLGAFKNQEELFKEKLKISRSETKLFVNGLDEFLKKSNGIKVDLKNDLFEIYNIKENPDCINFDLKIDKTYHVKYMVSNIKQLNNVALVIYVSLYLGVKSTKIVKSLNSFKSLENRMEIIKLKDKIVINDSYNSNYESLMSGLDTLKNYSLDKICVIGSILELGKHESSIYKKISTNLNQDYNYIFVGNNIKANNSIYFKDVYELIDYYYLNKDLFRNKVIYVKGSNGVKLIEFVNVIKNI